MTDPFDIRLTDAPIDPRGLLTSPGPQEGAFFLFTGQVRDSEEGAPIGGLIYEAYPAMALSEMRRLAEEILREHPIARATIVHRTGTIRVGEVAIAMAVFSRHRGEAIRFVERFMQRLKEDVPIWKTGVVGMDERG